MASASLPRISICPVDAGGALAEWVEGSVATEGQLTLVQFLGGGYGRDSLERSRPLAANLALNTGFRILTVPCRLGPDDAESVAVDRVLAAYRWLLCEGCDLDAAAFTVKASDHALIAAIGRAAIALNLPLPAESPLSLHSHASFLQPY